jgi:hypothetical protein
MSSPQMGDMNAQRSTRPPAGFVRGYHMVRQEHALGNITKCRLKVTRYSEANDPFELFALRVEDQAVRNELKSWKEEQEALTGLLCFSKRWDSTLMWSHYAAGHRGVCFGFDLRKDFVTPVTYKKARIEIESEGDELLSMSPELEMKLRCTKSDEWNYEQELRAFVPLSEAIEEAINEGTTLHFWPFEPRMRLVQVILGHRCELKLDDVRSAVATCGAAAATVFKARMAFKKFRITPNLRTLPRD